MMCLNNLGIHTHTIFVTIMCAMVNYMFLGKTSQTFKFYSHGVMNASYIIRVDREPNMLVRGHPQSTNLRVAK